MNVGIKPDRECVITDRGRKCAADPSTGLASVQRTKSVGRWGNSPDHDGLIAVIVFKAMRGRAVEGEAIPLL